MEHLILRCTWCHIPNQWVPNSSRRTPDSSLLFTAVYLLSRRQGAATPNPYYADEANDVLHFQFNPFRGLSEGTELDRYTQEWPPPKKTGKKMDSPKKRWRNNDAFLVQVHGRIQN